MNGSLDLNTSPTSSPENSFVRLKHSGSSNKKYNPEVRMNKQQNTNLVKKLFDEVFTKGNIALMDQLFTNDVKMHDPAAPNLKGGLAALKEKENMYKKAFPNKQLKIEELLATEDNRVVVLWSCQGVQKGEFQGLPSSGKNFRISGISIYTFKNDKISDIH